MNTTAPARVSIRRPSSVLIAAALVIGAFTFTAPAQAAQAGPSAAENATLAAYPVFDKAIEVLDTNKNNGIHAFLKDNLGKTVYMDTAILVYLPMNPNLTKAKIKQDKFPTDRFENAVMTSSCWIAREGTPQFTDFGEQGYPLPLDKNDIEAGCATRIRFVLLWGDGQPGTFISKDIDRAELFLTGFFEIGKEDLEGGKTLYTLTQKEVPVETDELFFTHKKVKDRKERLLPVATE